MKKEMATNNYNSEIYNFSLTENIKEIMMEKYF